MEDERSPSICYAYQLGDESDLEVRGRRQLALGQKARTHRLPELDAASHLNKLIAPHSPQEFAKKYFGVDLFHGKAKGREKNRFNENFGLEALRDLIATRAIPEASLVLFDSNGRELDLNEFKTPAYFPGKEKKALSARVLDPQKIIRKLLLDRGSIVLDDVGSFVPSVSRLESEFKAWTRQDICINAYFTGRRCQTFPWHWDNHDTFILQIAGEKEWSIFEPVFSLPLHHHNHWSWPEIGEKESKLRKKIVLREGDILHVPAGFPHFAKSLNQNSLHLTVGLYAPSWQNLVSDMFENALFESECEITYRQRIPFEADEQFRPTDKKVLRQLIRGAMPKPNDRMLRRLAASRSLRRGRLDIPSLQELWSTWADPRPLTGDTLLERTSLDWQIIEPDPSCGWLEIVLPQKKILTVAKEFLPAARFLKKKPSFRPKDLPGLNGLRRRIEYANLLIEEGLFIRKLAPFRVDGSRG